MAAGSAPKDPRRRSLPVAVDVPDDCRSCGACCFSPSATYIAVFAVDEARMDEAARALTDGGYMRFVDGRCSALRIEDGQYLCSIYPVRPDACRWLERGSSTCQAILLADLP